MPYFVADATRSLLVVVDVQRSFMKGIHEAERVLDRSSFLIKVARLLDIPVIVTEQYPDRMGGTEERILPLLDPASAPVGKMSFSCCGEGSFMEEIRRYDRLQAVIVGIETHICVSQTAHDLLSYGYEVIVCPDAVSARSLDRHKLGMERIRDGGAAPAHSEAVAYEWMGSADHPKFREALAIVKEHA